MARSEQIAHAGDESDDASVHSAPSGDESGAEASPVEDAGRGSAGEAGAGADAGGEAAAARVVEPLDKKALRKYEKKEKKKGVVYIARVPPFMKPAKIRSLMEQFGKVGRVFLTPEDERTREKRRRSGGNRKQNYKDGWVEFMDRKIAKRVALSLNCTPMGGKKRNWYHDDLWNLKYLGKKFKWSHLTEKVAHRNAVRREKLRAHELQARRANEQYRVRVEKARTREIIAERKRKRGDAPEGAGGSGGSSAYVVRQRKTRRTRPEDRAASAKVLSKLVETGE